MEQSTLGAVQKKFRKYRFFCRILSEKSDELKTKDQKLE